MRKNYLFSIIVLLCTLMSVSQAKADDYADYLTAANGFTEVTTEDGLKSGSNYYYVFQSFEDPTLVLANGRHAAKPDWASDGSWSLHYKNFAGMPLTDLNMYYQLEYASYSNVEGEKTYTGSGFGMKSAVNTSIVIGDDHLQKRAGYNPDERQYTHGTSAQRQRWFRRGFDTGDLKQGDTFSKKSNEL